MLFSVVTQYTGLEPSVKIRLPAIHNQMLVPDPSVAFHHNLDEHVRFAQLHEKNKPEDLGLKLQLPVIRTSLLSNRAARP